MKKTNIFGSILAGVKEFFRKKIVSLKRNTKIIPLLVLVVAFLVYSLNLTAVSFTVSIAQGSNLGLCEFVIMLFSVLSMVCLLNAYPRRQKPNIAMLVLVFAMIAVIVYCDLHFVNTLYEKIATGNIVINMEDKITSKVPVAYSMFQTHMIIEIIGGVCVALVPVFTKLLGLINTSVTIDDNGDMGEIEIAGE